MTMSQPQKLLLIVSMFEVARNTTRAPYYNKHLLVDSPSCLFNLAAQVALVARAAI